MFGILIVDMLFFGVPAVLTAFLGISIYRYVYARKKNRNAPETFSASEMKTRKIILIISAILAGVILTVFIGIITLMFLAVAFM